jgi:hypothetical protein
MFFLFEQCLFAGDNPIIYIKIGSGWWGIGEISGRILFYLPGDNLITGIPRSVFFFGLLITSIGILLAIILKLYKSPMLSRLALLIPLSATVGGYAFAWIVDSIGENVFDLHSVSLISLPCISAFIGGLVFSLFCLVLITKKKKRSFGDTISN